jgi:hypothetical protein
MNANNKTMKFLSAVGQGEQRVYHGMQHAIDYNADNKRPTH